MINLENITEDEPYVCFRDLYYNAITYSQKNIEAAAISTVSIDKKPSSRFVNIKYVNDKFIFFSNYNSQKGNDLDNNNNASLLFFWNAINVQIRIEGSVHKTTSVFSDKHFDVLTKEIEESFKIGEKLANFDTPSDILDYQMKKKKKK